jgi:hypothetical protein
MAVLLRELDIPARVAVGFTSGTALSPRSDTYNVTTDQAHAWVEVRFPVYGWLAFEPTPGRVNPVAASYADPVTPGCSGPHCDPAAGAHGNPGAGLRSSVAPPVKGGALNPQDPGQDRGVLRRGSRGADPFDGNRTRSNRFSAGRILLALLVLGLLGLLSVPCMRAWRRRRRLRRADGVPGPLILATYDVFTERAAELGYPRAPGETPEEYRSRVLATAPLASSADGGLTTLTRIVADAAYAPREPDQGQALAATSAAHTTLRQLQRATPWTTRVTGRFRPPS